MTAGLTVPTAGAALAAATARLAAAGVPDPAADAGWLLAGLLGIGRAALAASLDRALPAALADRLEDLLARRCRREPLQQVLGWEDFRGLRMRVTRDVLIPRPETEVLVEVALAALPAAGAGVRPRVVDVGTGSGCIAAAIAHERPDALVTALDTSAAALGVAQDNLRALGLAGRVRLVRGDLLEACRPGRLHLVVSNPPYLPRTLLPTLEPEVRDWEPVVALDGGPDGLAVVRRVVAGAAEALRPGGALVLETAGAFQARRVAALLAGTGFTGVRVERDLTGTDRIVSGRRPARRARAASSAGLAGATAASGGRCRKGGQPPLRE